LGALLLHLFFVAAIIFFLWRESIASHFNVTLSVKKATAVVAAVGSLLIVIFIALMFRL